MPDELAVLRTIEPETLAEAQAAVAILGKERTAVFPAGGGTALDFGLPATRPGVLLETATLEQIDDYPSEDLTITVQAGIRMAALADVLRRQNQMLPIDVPDAEQATLGGALATNTSGPRRYGYGTLRDYLIGIDVIDAAGNRVHGGGRVVKNVAGYDLMKLHTGALGTLGIVVQASLKLKPLPAGRLALCADVAQPDLETVLSRLAHSQTRPTAIDVLNAFPASFDSLGLPESYRAEPGPSRTLVLIFEEHPAAVVWQAERVRSELGPLATNWRSSETPGEYDRLLMWLTGWPANAKGVVFKANMLPGKVAELFDALEERLANVRLAAHAGSGIVWGAFEVSDAATAAQHLAACTPKAVAAGGNLIVVRAPAAWKTHLPVWGAPRPEAQWMQRLKGRLDPYDIFNPGRFGF